MTGSPVGAFLVGFVPGALALPVAGYVLNAAEGMGRAATVPALLVLALLLAVAFGRAPRDNGARAAGAIAGLLVGVAVVAYVVWSLAQLSV